VAKDYGEAAKGYRKAADLGLADAQVNLGFLYNGGQGVPKDGAEAAKWYRRAAEQGHAMAQFNLGLMYAKGQGIAKDDVQAHLWLTLAVRGASSYLREEWTGARDAVAGRMTPAQLADAEKLEKEWKPKEEGK
jgi:TPR repeat protein